MLGSEGKDPAGDAEAYSGSEGFSSGNPEVVGTFHYVAVAGAAVHWDPQNAAKINFRTMCTSFLTGSRDTLFALLGRFLMNLQGNLVFVAFFGSLDACKFAIQFD